MSTKPSSTPSSRALQKLRPSISTFPLELLVIIFSKLTSQQARSRAAQTCRFFHTLATPSIYSAPEFTSEQQCQLFIKVVAGNKQLGRIVKEINMVSTPGHWQFVTDLMVDALAEACPNLESLDLEGCRSIHDKSLYSIANSLPNISSLSIAFCARITDSGLFYLLGRCRRLRNLELTCIPRISDAGLQPLTFARSFLETLNLSGTRVADDSVRAIISRAPDLVFLDVSSCYNLLDREEIVAGKPDTLEIVTNSLPRGTAEWDEEYDDIYDELDELEDLQATATDIEVLEEMHEMVFTDDDDEQDVDENEAIPGPSEP
ncbi:hypothetical protein HKX48_002876 [Thoreauomyces humboldtii]|nr:hypothetical protein HKX48_002876 [Thoreauomyces humboldtii]